MQVVSLHDAAKVGDVEALKRLLEGGADVNAQDARGVTALGVAVGFNRLPVVTALLEAGADVSKVDRRGNTVLHYAAGWLSQIAGPYFSTHEMYFTGKAAASVTKRREWKSGRAGCAP